METNNISYSEDDCFYLQGLDENYDSNVKSLEIKELKTYNGN